MNNNVNRQGHSPGTSTSSVSLARSCGSGEVVVVEETEFFDGGFAFGGALEASLRHKIYSSYMLFRPLKQVNLSLPLMEGSVLAKGARSLIA